VLALAALGFSAAAGPQKTGEEVVLDGLKSKVPAAWKTEKPGNKFRAFQFRVPKAEGDKEDAELVIFFFGPNQGGTAEQNVKRWKGFFIPPKGKDIDEATQVNKMKVSDVPVTYVDIQGTYKFKKRPFDENEKPELKPNFRQLGNPHGAGP